MLAYQVRILKDQINWFKQQLNVFQQLKRDVEFNSVMSNQLIDTSHLIKAQNDLVQVIQSLEIQMNVLVESQVEIDEEESQVVKHLFNKNTKHKDNYESDSSEDYVTHQVE